MRPREHPQRRLILLLLILVLFTISPLLLAFHYGVVVLNIVGASVLLAATCTMSARKRLFSVAMTLSLISIVTTGLLAAFPQTWAVLISHTSIIILVSFFAITIMDYVVRQGRVTADKIYAAICVYMLIGYAWAFAYSLLEEITPGSFTSPVPIEHNDYVGRVMQLRYFSFVTLATVGFGDVVPRSPLARTLAMLEAIVVQFYLVALVGRLIGLHIVTTTDSTSRDKN